jgi:membrane-bound lytic murein transglycosylase D
MFGDWHLALAAYNWGQGNVQKAIARNQKLGLPTDYASLRMPDETRNYVPKLQAVKNIVARPEAFAIVLPPLEDHPYFISVPIERDIDVELAAQFSGLTIEQFQQLNPQMNKPVILAAGTPQVLLPYDNANLFLRQLTRHQGPLATWTAWVATRTVSAADAARQVGMSEARMREVNRIPAHMLVKAGSTLLVPRGAHATADVAEHVAEHASIALAPEQAPGRKVRFVAGKRGDSVAAVARRYGISATAVATANGVATNSLFKAGQTVLVNLPAAKPTRVAAQKPTRKVTARPTQRTAVNPKVRVARQ